MTRAGDARLVVALILAACGRAAAPESPSGAAAGAPVTWQARAAGGLAPIEPGTRELALLDAEACDGCHAEQHAEWARSRHGAAWRNGIFQREYRAQPRAWCVNCHAPLAPQQEGLREGDSRLADQGVSCAACHVRRGVLVSARRAPGSPHATAVDPTFGSPAMCGDCHQFNFPVLRGSDGVAVAMTRHPMQPTVADFLAGPYRDAPRGCLTCHDSPSGHAFLGAHDRRMLERALFARWCRRGDEVVVEVANVGAGHRVPTGDIHRHLLARVWRSSAPESTFEAFFGRRFRVVPDGGRETIWDSTLAPKQRRTFAVPVRSLGPAETPAPDDAEPIDPAAWEPPPDDEPLNFEVTYVYTADEIPNPRRDPGEPVVMQLIGERARFADLAECAEAPR